MYLVPESFKNTFCIFKEVDLIQIDSRISDYTSMSGSSYYYSVDGMFRLSNHWGRLANSKWRLEPADPPSESKIKLGFAAWTGFYLDNSNEELYYIKADFNTNTVNYHHRSNPEFDKKAVLRTSFKTGKRIKQIRNLLELNSWSKHFEFQDLQALRQMIVLDLIETNKTLEEIKSAYL